jgi:hypothetical protein
MKEFEITCVNKPDRMSAHEHITHIGNTANNWRMTREEAIRRIESKQEAYPRGSPKSGHRGSPQNRPTINRHPGR